MEEIDTALRILQAENYIRENDNDLSSKSFVLYMYSILKSVKGIEIKEEAKNKEWQSLIQELL